MQPLQIKYRITYIQFIKILKQIESYWIVEIWRPGRGGEKVWRNRLEIKVGELSEREGSEEGWNITLKYIIIFILDNEESRSPVMILMFDNALVCLINPHKWVQLSWKRT